MKKSTIALKSAAIAAVWLALMPLLGILISSDDWFWYHYIGTMPIDTYRLLSATIGIASFIGAIVLLLAAVVVTVWICGGFAAKPDQKSAT